MDKDVKNTRENFEFAPPIPASELNVVTNYSEIEKLQSVKNENEETTD